jgi:glycine/D-amino acid oxidase-like deaminating enzyme/nitrite reductase/ring-hydroxylating ferredoxin subunit
MGNTSQGNFAKTPQPFWIVSTPQTEYRSLNDDIEVDIAIIGGGITGVTSAYLLKQEGYKIALLEADRIVQGTTGHTTAKITSQHTLIYDSLKKQIGEEKARQYAEANETAIKEISRLIQEKNIDCNFSWQSAYVYTQQEEYVSQLINEVNAASSLGIKASFLSEIPLPITIKGAMRFDNQAQFHPRKYLLTLAQDIPGNGSYIFEQTKVVDVKEDKPSRVITASGNKVIAHKVIIASHYPCYEAMGLFFTRIYPERSYILGIKAKEKFPGGMYITAEDPKRSLRAQVANGSELILIAGEHHKTGQGEDTNNHYQKLKDFSEKIFEIEDIPYRWSTQDYTTMDKIPYIGHLTSGTPNIYVATGFNKWGMTNGTTAALILKDLILNGSSPWEDIYDPSRFTPSASAKSFVKENLNVAKHLISGKIMPVPSNMEIPQGEGKIIDLNGQRVGAYRDKKGSLHMVDTTCTHMGCELQWNSAETSWDCPCHGSRFTYEGENVEGPALQKLSHIIQQEIN